MNLMNKPLVIEEFGLPRDDESLDIAAATTQRDIYYRSILERIGNDPFVSGANFWAYGGVGRSRTGNRKELMGDPPMEPQGLNSVFDTDRTTWRVIDAEARRLRAKKKDTSEAVP